MIPVNEVVSTSKTILVPGGVPQPDQSNPSAAGAGAQSLRTAGLHAWFGKRHVLADINLDFPAKSVTGLIGPSGCGKSTFIRMLNRMHEFLDGAAMAGEVFLEGQNIYGASIDPIDIRRRVGMVFQKPNPFPAMSIGENVVAGLKLSGIKGGDRAAVTEHCLVRAGLWREVKDRLKAPAGSLSGGQQQRLCIARSLAITPSVLLMDEPCSALDPSSTLRIEETIAELSQDMTIVIVTHNMQQAARVSQYCAFFLAQDGPGYIVEADRTDTIFTNPKDQRTNDYVSGRFG